MHWLFEKLQNECKNPSFFHKASYRRLARQPQTCFVAVFARKKLRCTRIAYTDFAVCTIFSLNISLRKNLLFRNFTISSVKRFKARDTRNLSEEVTSATWRNLYTRFISRIFLCCKHVLRTSHESSIASLRLHVLGQTTQAQLPEFTFLAYRRWPEASLPL